MEVEFYCYYYVLGAAVIILLLKHAVFNNHGKKKSPPSPRALPIIGHLHLIKNSLHLALSSLSSQHGPIISLKIGCKSFLVVSSPSVVEECFTKNDITFASRPKTMSGDHLTYNYVAYAFAPYGHLWRILRRVTVVELFSTASLHKSALVREEQVRSLLRLVLLKASENGSQQTVDLNYAISTFTCNVMMRLVCGRPWVGEEDAAGEAGTERVAKFRRIFFTSFSMSACDFFPVLKWFGYKGLQKKLISLHEKRNVFLQGLIDEARQKFTAVNNSSASVKSGKKVSLVETFLSLQESDPDFYTDDIIKSIILMMFVAGTETSSVTLEWAMSLLLRHPEELNKLRAEIDNVVGHERLLNESDLAKLPYLHCIVNETLRLYPPVPLLLPHYSSQDCVVGGYEIPRDTIVVVNAWAMHRDPKVWEEPNKFKPERFKSVEAERDGFKFVPFGMGRRACPGANMGLRTILLALGSLVHCFDWEKVHKDDEIDMTYVTRITMQKAQPLEAVCVPRHTQLLD